MCVLRICVRVCMGSQGQKGKTQGEYEATRMSGVATLSGLRLAPKARQPGGFVLAVVRAYQKEKEMH